MKSLVIFFGQIWLSGQEWEWRLTNTCFWGGRWPVSVMYDAEGTEGFWPSGRLFFRSRKYATHYITVSGQMCHKEAMVEYIIFPAYEEVDLLFISTDCNSVKGVSPNHVFVTHLQAKYSLCRCKHIIGWFFFVDRTERETRRPTTSSLQKFKGTISYQILRSLLQCN